MDTSLDKGKRAKSICYTNELQRAANGLELWVDPS